MGPGENAGAVDVGDGLAFAFKVESHNHPSAVEPFQGAATGVGGILRDIFAIGARPIAVLDSLRFGEPAESARSRYLLERAVAGIGHYGNSIGVPTVGGEIYFEGPYEQNCLVNAMCARARPARAPDPRRRRRARQRRRAARRADRPRRDRRRVGAGQRRARRGRRGQAPDRADRRPVRGEEAARVLAGAARPRAAGLAAGPRRRRPDVRRRRRWRARARSGSTSTCASVPLREAGMEPFEIMVSESQERMLCVVEPERRRRGAGGLRALGGAARRAIGAVTDTRRLRVFERRRRWSATCRSTALVDDCPLYDLEPEQPARAAVPARRRGR